MVSPAPSNGGTLRDRVRSTVARYPRLWDGAIAVVCLVATVAEPGKITDPRPVVLICASVSALPIVWRRRAPFTVALLCGVGALGLIAAHGEVNWPYGQLVATYTVAAYSRVAARAVIVAATAAGVVFTQQVYDKDPASILYSGGVFATAFALGIGARARRDRIALLEERALRHAEERAAVSAREREGIARDMHDILAHSISLIAVQAEAGPLLVHRDPDRAVRSFETISDTAHDALTQLRCTLGILRAAPNLAGIPALAQRARETGLGVSVTERGEPFAVGPDAAEAAYRVVQESLTNAVRHAGAAAVRVELDWSSDRLRVEITDDGPGVVNVRPGNGLTGMRERVIACDGDFRAGVPPDGTGFVVTATFPSRRSG
ncbi:sensor histidine kinase [Solwaraspora sp. WMMD791]|uniref:sensor histidine kinase n=1 Tax=Solwaraspora sp. WMMD791 TaxID=3016086 RepID=UPI00249AD226|nr:sensor histidine kinase [Solwaraspora sp. WMMD791]WFE28761.1 sensor histidine kinase [Solwaraspora sp. WMMD791]